MEHLRDEEILARSYRDPRLFGELVGRYQKSFFKKSIYILKSREDAEDAVQEAFVRIYKHGEKFAQSNRPFKPWAYTIVQHTAIDIYTKRKRSGYTVEFNEEIFSGGDFENETEDTREYQGIIASILKTLKKPFRAVLSLYFLEEKSCKEIAKLTGQSPVNVRVKLFRAKKMFKAAYQRIQHD